MEIQLKLNAVGRSTFLNFWDYEHGNDVVCEVKKGKLFLVTCGSKKATLKEITLAEFLKRVKRNAKRS